MLVLPRRRNRKWPGVGPSGQKKGEANGNPSILNRHDFEFTTLILAALNSGSSFEERFETQKKKKVSTKRKRRTRKASKLLRDLGDCGV